MDKKTEYVEKLSAQIVEWDVQIDLLKEKRENATPEAKINYSEDIAVLQLKRNLAAEKLQKISVASGDEWEELKNGAEQIWSEVKGLLRNAVRKKD